MDNSMKSKRAKDYLLDTVSVTSWMYLGHPEECDLKLKEAKHAVELAEAETEERILQKAHQLIKGMMNDIFNGDMPQKIADEFIRKMNNKNN